MCVCVCQSRLESLLMNLFYLEEDPEACAESHCNKHVPKMTVETAQLLCNVHHRMKDDVKKKDIPYKYSRSGHVKLAPMIWLMQSIANYRWTVQLGLCLAKVYTQRFGGKIHKTQRVLEWLQTNEPIGLPQCDMTTPLCAMPDEYKVKGEQDPMHNYRTYYVYDKHRFAVWPEGKEPKWFTEGVNLLKQKGLYNEVDIAYPTKNQQKLSLKKRKQSQILTRNAKEVGKKQVPNVIDDNDDDVKVTTLKKRTKR